MICSTQRSSACQMFISIIYLHFAYQGCTGYTPLQQTTISSNSDKKTTTWDLKRSSQMHTSHQFICSCIHFLLLIGIIIIMKFLDYKSDVWFLFVLLCFAGGFIFSSTSHSSQPLQNKKPTIKLVEESTWGFVAARRQGSTFPVIGACPSEILVLRNCKFQQYQIAIFVVPSNFYQSVQNTFEVSQ